MKKRKDILTASQMAEVLDEWEEDNFNLKKQNYL